MTTLHRPMALECPKCNYMIRDECLFCLGTGTCAVPFTEFGLPDDALKWRIAYDG